MLNTSKGVAVVCSGYFFNGTMPGGTGLPGTGIATLTNVTFSSCIATGGFSTTITANNLPWSFNAVSYNSSTGVTSGTLTGFSITVTVGGYLCTYTIGAPGGGPGTISMTFDNNISVYNPIDVRGTILEVQTTSGASCGSLPAPGDDVEFVGRYGVTLPNAPQAITSP